MNDDDSPQSINLSIYPLIFVSKHLVPHSDIARKHEACVSSMYYLVGIQRCTCEVAEGTYDDDDEEDGDGDKEDDGD